MSSKKHLTSISETLFLISSSKFFEQFFLQIFLFFSITFLSRLYLPRSKAANKLANWWKQKFLKKLKIAHIETLKNSFSNILKKKTELNKSKQFIESYKFDISIINELIFLICSFKMLFLNSYFVFKRTFWSTFEMFIIQAKAVTILLMLKFNVNLTSLLNLTAKTFRKQYMTKRTLKWSTNLKNQTKYKKLNCFSSADTCVIISSFSQFVNLFTDLLFSNLSWTFEFLIVLIYIV